MNNKMGMSVLGGWTISCHLYSEPGVALYEANKNDNGLILKAGIKIYTIPLSKKKNQAEIIKRLHEKMYIAANLRSDHILNCEEYEINENDDSIDLIIRQECATPISLYICHNTFTEAALIKMFRDITEALRAAKTEDISHNSITPNCIYICDNGKYKLADFQIAAYLSELGVIQNNYSPTGAEDNNKDIFGLGINMYLLLNFNKISLQNGKIVSLKDSFVYRNKNVLLAAPNQGGNKFKEIVYRCISADKESRINDLNTLYSSISDIPCAEEQSSIQINLESIPEAEKISIQDNTTVKKKNSNKFLLIIPGILIFVTAIVIISSAGIYLLSSKKEMVNVPKFKGLTTNEAINKAASSHVIIKTKEVYSDEIEAGYVADQKIKEGTSVEENSVVVLQISKGAEKITVPEYTGKTLNEVLATERNILIQYIEVNNDLPLGTIVGQDVIPGESVSSGSIITLTVSLGKELKAVPDFSKMKQPKVKKLCESLGLNYVIIREPNEDIKRNYCISQSVAAYSVITTDTCVEIHISEGSGKKEDKSSH